MAFDQSLQISVPTQTNFFVLWSSTPTPSGHYVGAFANGSLGKPSPAITAKNLIGFLRQINNVHNVGFLVLGSPPPASSSTQQQAFAQSVLNVAAGYPQFSTGFGIGGMILWLPALDAFDPTTAFALFTPSTGPAAPYQLAQGAQRLFDAGGGNRLLSANAAGASVQLNPLGDMTIALQSTGNPLALSFGPTPYYAGVAASSAGLTIQLDPSQPNAGNQVLHVLPGFQMVEHGQRRIRGVHRPQLDETAALRSREVHPELEAGDRVISLGPEEGAPELETLTRAPAGSFPSGF